MFFFQSHFKSTNGLQIISNMFQCQKNDQDIIIINLRIEDNQYITQLSMYISREKAPGQTQCDTVIQQLNDCVRHLDQTSINVVSTVTPSQENTLQGMV